MFDNPLLAHSSAIDYILTHLPVEDTNPTLSKFEQDIINNRIIARIQPLSVLAKKHNVSRNAVHLKEHKLKKLIGQGVTKK